MTKAQTLALAVADALLQTHWTHATERTIGDRVQAVLAAKFPEVTLEREFVTMRGRLDFLLTSVSEPIVRVGLELKVAGGYAATMRQVARYLEACPAIDAFIIASTKHTAIDGLPSEIGGKPILTAYLRTFP